jgi:ParB/RepB/Spo0J family partition protein
LFRELGQRASKGDGMETIQVPLSKLKEHPDNPRKDFAGVDELSTTMKSLGILQPLQVRQLNGYYEILSGAKRFRAAKAAGLESAPVNVRKLDDTAAYEFMINANLQSLPTPLEEAEAYGQMQKKFGYTLQRMAQVTAKTEAYVYERLKLLQSIPDLKKLLAAQKIPLAHALMIAKLKPEEQKRVIRSDDPAAGGLFTYDMNQVFDFDEDPEPSKDKFRDLKPVSLRQLQYYIAHHVRFDKAKPDPMLFPETAKKLEEAAGQKQKVVQVTHNTFTQPDAKEGNTERIYHGQSWKPADGSSKHAKACEKSVVGVIVVGPEQGKALNVCIDKSCPVHWLAEKKAKEKSNADVSRWRKDQEKQLKKQRAESRREYHRQAVWESATPAIIEAFAERVKTVPLGPIAEVIDRRLPSEALDAARRLLPKWKTAEDLLRLVALAMLVRETSEHWYSRREMPARAKRFGVDVGPLLKAHAELVGLSEATCLVCGLTDEELASDWVKLNEKTNAGVCTSCQTTYPDTARDALAQIGKLSGKEVRQHMAAKKKLAPAEEEKSGKPQRNKQAQPKKKKGGKK